jgi:hypothetical protein
MPQRDAVRAGDFPLPTRAGIPHVLSNVLLQHAEAFRTTIVEQLLVYASTGSVDAAQGTPDTLIRARRILRATPNPRWSALIAAIVQ